MRKPGDLPGQEICSKCKRSLDLSKFGKAHWCRECINSYMKPRSKQYLASLTPEQKRFRNARKQRNLRRSQLVTDPVISYRRIVERDGWHCYICSNPINNIRDLEFDHVVPVVKGGVHEEYNLSPTHASCNNSKNGCLIENWEAELYKRGATEDQIFEQRAFILSREVGFSSRFRYKSSPWSAQEVEILMNSGPVEASLNLDRSFEACRLKWRRLNGRLNERYKGSKCSLHRTQRGPAPKNCTDCLLSIS